MWYTIFREIQHLSNPNLIFLYASCLLCFFYQSGLPKAYKRLSWYLFFNLFIEISAHIAAHLYHQNLPLLHFYTLGELWLWALFYSAILGNNTFLNRYFLSFLGFISMLVVLNSIFLQSIFGYNSYAKTLVQFIIIYASLSYAFYFPEDKEADNQSNRLLKIVNYAVLFYYCTTIFIYMSSNFWLGSDRREFIILSDVNRYLNALFQLTLLIVLWKVTRNHQKSSFMSSSV
jgi:hypothetical protein